MTFSIHKKEGKPDSLRVDYWDGWMVVASEWACFEHSGYARQKAEQWWYRMGNKRNPPQTSAQAGAQYDGKKPTRIATRRNGKYTEIVSYDFSRTESNQGSIEKEFA